MGASEVAQLQHAHGQIDSAVQIIRAALEHMGSSQDTWVRAGASEVGDGIQILGIAFGEIMQILAKFAEASP